MPNIRRLFDDAVKAARHRALIPGVLGKPDGVGGYTVAVSGRANHVYVRVSSSGSESVTMARNVNKVAYRANLPVLMELEVGGAYTIVGEDPAYYSAATTGDTTNTTGIAQHTHRSDTALAYEVEAKMLAPGRVFHSAAYTVYVKPLRYYYDGAWKYWTGGSLNLLAYLPSTSTTWGWILVGLDPVNNEPVATNGAEVATQAELLIEDLANITFTGYIPLAAIAANEADADLSDYTRYYDASEWHGGLLLQFNDAEGSSANVTTATPADGTSDFAARRDHAHGIADSAVTLAKMANLAQGYVLGKATAAAGPPEPMLIGIGLDYNATTGHLLRGPLTGDVVASSGSANTTIDANKVTNGMIRDSAALSVIGRSANSSGDPADIATTATSDAVLRESGSALGFGTVATGGIADAAVTNAKIADMAQATIKGRAANAGTGVPADLSRIQAVGVVGGALYVDNNGDGNVGTGEDTLSTYTVVADTLGAYSTLWFEVTGTFAANGNSKRIRIYFETTVIFDFTTTASNADWLAMGRVVCVGGASERTHVRFEDSAGSADLQHTIHTESLTVDNDLIVTGEATADDDIQVITMVVGHTAATV